MYAKTHREKDSAGVKYAVSKDDKYADIKDSENQNKQSQYYQLGMERKLYQYMANENVHGITLEHSTHLSLMDLFTLFHLLSPN